MVVIVLCCCFLGFFLVFVVWPWWKFRRVDVPGPAPEFLLGNARQMFAGGLRNSEKVFSAWREQYGGISRVWFGPFQLQVNVSEPEAVKTILTSPDLMSKMNTYQYVHPWLGLGLLTSTGSLWQRKRRMLTPAFHFSVVKSYNEVMIRHAAVLVDQLRKAGSSSVNIMTFISHLTLDVIGESAFGVEIRAQTSTENQGYIDAVRDATNEVLERLGNPLYYSSLYWLLPAGRRHARTLHQLHSFCDAVIDAKRQELAQRRAQLAAGQEPEPTSFVEMLLLMKVDGQPLSDQEIRDEVNTFMFEGHDTTSQGIAWSLFLLAREQQAQQRIRDELRGLLGPGRTALTADDVANVSKLHYFHLFLRESQRLYPPVPAIGRRVDKDMKLGPYTLVAGANVAIDIYQLHHNPLVWDQPEAFRPERFDRGGEAETKSPFSFVPFSAGARNCIGKVMAVNEEFVTLATILLNFSLTLDPTVSLNPAKEGRLILAAADPLLIKFEKLS